MRRILAGILLSTALAAPAPAAPSFPRLAVERGADAAIVDESGRQVLLRGVNVNQLGDYYAYDPARPTIVPLARQDFAGMAKLGFNVVRLVLNWSALEPERGVISEPYLARVRQAVGWAREHGLYVVLDMHQDSWGKFIATPPGTTCEPGLGPAVGWDGAPEWATLTDGLTTCRAADTRELSPAVARAFDSFYDDRDGIQGELVGVWARLAREFGGDPAIAGYDLINEPHPGFRVGAAEATALGTFYARAIAAIRDGERQAPGGFPHVVFFEPSVIWSGFGADSLPPPGFTPDGNISFAPHLYAESITVDRKLGITSVSIEQGFEAARQAAATYQAPLWSGEWAWFGEPADDEPKVRRYIALEDRHRIGSAWWVWKQACGDPHVAGAPTFSGSLNPLKCPEGTPLGQVEPYARLISRPYARHAPGRLTTLAADPDTGKVLLRGRDDDPAGSCELVVWIPDRGRGAPRLAGTNVASLRVQGRDGGWVVTGCATGGWELGGEPDAASVAPRTTPATCRSRRVVALSLRTKIRRAKVRVSGTKPRRVRVRGGRTVILDLRGTRKARVVVTISGVRAGNGRRYVERRIVNTCVPRRS